VGERLRDDRRFLVLLEFPNATLSLSVAVACAAADPPNSFVSSRRISFCASAAFPPSTSALIWSFCCFVNDTPTAAAS
jgi:hypothetical protein